MTDSTTSSPATEAPRTDTENVVPSAAPVVPHKKNFPLLAFIAIALTCASAAGLYYYNQRQALTFQHQLSQLKTEQTSEQQKIAAQLLAQQQQIQNQQTTLLQYQALLDSQTKQLNGMSNQLSNMSGHDGKAWLLAQADFMVKLAARKLWSEQDITSAGTLLKIADTSLADMNDPSLLDARRALADDIATLSNLAPPDLDSISLQINQLASQVDNLPLTGPILNDAPMDSSSEEVSGTLSEWRENLSKSWQQFMAQFITIRPRDTSAEPLLAPHQEVYLRENIRSQLLIASQAVPRHQAELYKLSLDTVSAWVRTYFDTDNVSTKAFLEQLEQLSQESITTELPEQLKSQPFIEQLMQQRVRQLLAQPTAMHKEG